MVLFISWKIEWIGVISGLCNSTDEVTIISNVGLQTRYLQNHTWKTMRTSQTMTGFSEFFLLFYSGLPFSGIYRVCPHYFASANLWEGLLKFMDYQINTVEEYECEWIFSESVHFWMLLKHTWGCFVTGLDLLKKLQCYSFNTDPCFVVLHIYAQSHAKLMCFIAFPPWLAVYQYLL